MNSNTYPSLNYLTDEHHYEDLKTILKQLKIIESRIKETEIFHLESQWKAPKSYLDNPNYWLTKIANRKRSLEGHIRNDLQAIDINEKNVLLTFSSEAVNHYYSEDSLYKEVEGLKEDSDFQWLNLMANEYIKVLDSIFSIIEDLLESPFVMSESPKTTNTIYMLGYFGLLDKLYETGMTYKDIAEFLLKYNLIPDGRLNSVESRIKAYRAEPAKYVRHIKKQFSELKV